MKEKIKEFLALPPVIALITLVAYALISPLIPHPAERISVSTYMKYHSTEELVEYWQEHGDINYVIDCLAEEFNDSYCLMTQDESQHMVNGAYARGYYDGATREQDEFDHAIEKEIYDKISNAIDQGDIDTVHDYTAGSFIPSDFLD